MSELAKAIRQAGIDDIVDDEEFVEAENDFIREYCIKHNFDISEKDMNEIRNRGMDDAFEDWKYEFKIERNVDNMSKLRVWWIPQVGIEQTFYVPVSTVEEGKKILDLLTAYDAFQLQNNVKPDYSNVGGLQMLDKTTGEWEDWFLESDYYFVDDVDDYCANCENTKELEEFKRELFEQIDWEWINEINYSD